MTLQVAMNMDRGHVSELRLALLTWRTKRNAKYILTDTQVCARHATQHCHEDTKVIAAEEAVAILVWTQEGQ